MRFTHSRRECLPGVPDAVAVPAAFPIAYVVIFIVAVAALVALTVAGQPLLLTAVAVKVLLGAFGLFIYRTRR